MISPEHASLLLHKLITESTRVVAWFVSPDGEVRSKIAGRVSGLSELGLSVVSDSETEASLLVAAAALARSTFEYDEARGREGVEFESGLAILLPSGARLTLLESKSIDSTS